MNINYLDAPYLFYVDFIIKSKLNQDQQKEFNEMAVVCSKCFNLAKENKILDSEKFYIKSYEINNRINPLVLPWVILFCWPHLSYYHYKVKDYNKAISYTNKIIESIRLLQREGFQYLFFSEIQQRHNLSRIYYSMDDIENTISFCVKCLKDIVEHSSKWNTGMLIKEVHEEELIKITQYSMIIQITTETCSGIIRRFKEDRKLLKKWLGKFIEPSIKLNFELISSELRYKNLAHFFLVMRMIIKKGIESVDQNDLLFVKDPSTNKELLDILYNFAKILIK